MFDLARWLADAGLSPYAELFKENRVGCPTLKVAETRMVTGLFKCSSLQGRLTGKGASSGSRHP